MYYKLQNYDIGVLTICGYILSEFGPNNTQKNNSSCLLSLQLGQTGWLPDDLLFLFLKIVRLKKKAIKIGVHIFASLNNVIFSQQLSYIWFGHLRHGCTRCTLRCRAAG